MNRAQRRAGQKSNKKGEKPNKEIDNIMGMFDLLPDECSAYNVERCRQRRKESSKIILPRLLEHCDTNHQGC